MFTLRSEMMNLEFDRLFSIVFWRVEFMYLPGLCPTDVQFSEDQNIIIVRRPFLRMYKLLSTPFNEIWLSYYIDEM